ncbi:MAG: DUF2786 domain-containing protein [Nevskiaceae bacterium]|nr:MAG: DUF2786 domain-containing protein [Nevskiaceae bacterium]
MEDRAKIIERVANLLRMASDTSSPNEAAIAARRARQLMDKHQVGLHELGAAADEFAKMSFGKAYRFMPQYRNILSVAVAKFNDCIMSFSHEYYAVQGHYRRRVQFKGYKSDAIIAGNMYDYLTDTIDRLCAEYIKSTGHVGSYPAAIGDAFKKGAAQEICWRLDGMMAEREKDTQLSTGTSLVVVKAAEVEAKFGPPKYREMNITTRNTWEADRAKNAGHEAGSKINLSTQVENDQVKHAKVTQ